MAQADFLDVNIIDTQASHEGNNPHDYRAQGLPIVSGNGANSFRPNDIFLHHSHAGNGRPSRQKQVNRSQGSVQRQRATSQG